MEPSASPLYFSGVPNAAVSVALAGSPVGSIEGGLTEIAVSKSRGQGAIDVELSAAALSGSWVSTAWRPSGAYSSNMRG